MKVVRGSLTVYQSIYGFPLYGRDADTDKLTCLGELSGLVDGQELEKRGGDYDPNDDPTLPAHFAFMLVEPVSEAA